jgi:hypothetical protein
LDITEREREGKRKLGVGVMRETTVLRDEGDGGFMEIKLVVL